MLSLVMRNSSILCLWIIQIVSMANKCSHSLTAWLSHGEEQQACGKMSISDKLFKWRNKAVSTWTTAKKKKTTEQILEFFSLNRLQRKGQGDNRTQKMKWLTDSLHRCTDKYQCDNTKKKFHGLLFAFISVILIFSVKNVL